MTTERINHVPLCSGADWRMTSDLDVSEQGDINLIGRQQRFLSITRLPDRSPTTKEQTTDVTVGLSTDVYMDLYIGPEV